MAIRAAQLEVEVGTTGVDKTSAGLRSVANTINDFATAPRRAVAGLLDFTSKMGFAVFGAQQLAGAVKGMVPALFDQNIAYENASAQIMAFTKDAGKTAEILDMVRTRAAATPFAFNEMASSAANLIPVARTTGLQLEELIKTSEILAASNPAEGLQGAAFALKEAASGDFTSIIERFNLSRTTLNRLKEEGVPALEAVKIAMAEMGYDTELVTNMANTAQGRWSTFVDTLNNVKFTVMQKAFEVLSGSLAKVQTWLDSNQETISRWAETAGKLLVRGVTGAITAITALVRLLSGPAVTAFRALSFAIASVLDGWKQTSSADNANWLETIGYRARQVADFLVGAFQYSWVLARDAVLTFIQALQGNWSDDGQIRPLHRAMGMIGTIIRDRVIPAVKAIAAFTTGTLIPAFQRFIGWLTGTGVPGFRRFASTVSEVFTERILPAVRGAINAIMPIVQRLFTFFQQHRTTILQVGAAIGGAMLAFKLVIGPVTAVVGAFQMLSSTGLLPLLMQIPRIASMVGLLIGALNPVTLIVLAVVAAVVLLALAWTNNWGDIQGKTQAVLAVIMPFLQNMWNRLQAFVTMILPELRAAWENVWTAIQTVVGAAVLIIMTVFNAISAFVQEHGDTIRAILTSVWEFISRSIDNALAIISNVIQLVLNVIQGDWEGAWENVKAIAESLWDQLVNYFETTMEILPKILSLAWEAIVDIVTEAIPKILGKIGELASAFTGWVADATPELLGKVGGLLEELGGWITGTAAPAIKEKLAEWVTAFVGWVMEEGWPKLVTKLNELRMEVQSWILNVAAPALTEKVKEWATAILSWVADAITALPEKLGEILTAIGGWITEKAGDIAAKGAEIGTGLMGGLAGAIKGFDLSGIITWIWDAIKGGLAERFEIFSPSRVMRDDIGIPIMQGLVLGIQDGTPDAVKAAADAAKSVADAFAAWLDIGARVSAGASMPAQAAVDAFVDRARATLDRVREAVAGWTTEGLSLAKEFADTSKSIFDAFGSALGLFTKDNGRLPTLADIGYLKSLMEHAITSIRDTANYIGTEGLDAASKVAEVGGIIADAFGNLLNAFKGDGVTLPSLQLISDLKFRIEHMVVSIRDTALFLQGEGLEAARIFAETAQPIVDLVGAGVEAFKDFLDPATLPTKAAISAFKFVIEHLVQSFRDTALHLGSEGMDAVVKFADAAGAILGIVGDGVNALKALNEGYPAVSQAAATGFKNMVVRIVSTFKDVALAMQGPALDAVSDFASAAGDILGIIGDAIEGLKALATGFPAVSQKLVTGFKNMVVRVVSTFKQVATDMAGPGLTAVSDFASAAGDILGIVGDAIEGFTMLVTADLSANVDRQLQLFSAFVVKVVTSLRTAIGSLSGDGLTVAKDFADTGAAILDAIGGAVEAFTFMGSKDFIVPATKQLDAFIAFIYDAVDKLMQVSKDMSSDGLKVAKEFADTGKSIFDLIAGAVNFDGFPKLGLKFTAGVKSFLDNVKDAVALLIQAGQQLGTGLTEAADIATKIKQIMDLLAPAGTSSGSSGGSGGGSGLGGVSRPISGGYGPLPSSPIPGAPVNPGGGGSATSEADWQRISQMIAQAVAQAIQNPVYQGTRDGAYEGVRKGFTGSAI